MKEKINTEKYSYVENEVFSVLLLIILVLVTSFSSDKWIPNSQLALPLIISLTLTTFLVALGIPQLRLLKMNQTIREDGPKKHFHKSGTPTMGGLLVIPVGVIVGSLITIEKPASEELLIVSAVTLAFMFIGSLDDWSSLTRGINTGLSPKVKLILQAVAASLFLIVASRNDWIMSTVSLSFGWSINLGLFIWPLALFTFLAESNATNLTDGLDGLASGCGALVFTGQAIQLMLRGHSGDPALAGFCMAMAGAWLGVLGYATFLEIRRKERLWLQN